MIKKIFLLLFSYFLFTNYWFANNYIEKTIDWYKFRVIKYDTDSKDYIFKIWANLDYSATNLRDLMEANNGISAINWVFFCPASYPECGWQNFTKNERYIEWEKIWKEESTWNRVVFAVDKNNDPFLFQTDKINPNDEWEIYYWFANFPLLLQNWENKIQDYIDLWLVDKKMIAKMQRNFICSDRVWRYIYTWYVWDIALKDLWNLLIKFGCYNALNLDAWWSSAMIYNSKYIIWPARDIMDWIIIERKGLDTKELRDNSKKIIEIIKNRILDKTYTERLEYVDTLTKGLSKIRSDIYNKYSVDIFESWERVWYEINVSNLIKLKSVYMVNYLNKLFYDLKQDYINEENIRIEREKNNQNWQNLLF